jgi:hypothetical protein
VYFLSYLISPRFCHAIVGYLEEEAVKTYTHCLEDMEKTGMWKDKPVPKMVRGRRGGGSASAMRRRGRVSVLFCARLDTESLCLRASSAPTLLCSQ